MTTLIILFSVAPLICEFLGHRSYVSLLSVSQGLIDKVPPNDDAVNSFLLHQGLTA